MKRLALVAALSIAAVAVFDIPSALAQQQCGANKTCLTNKKTTLHIGGPIEVDSPIFPTDTTLGMVVDGGVTIVGTTTINGATTLPATLTLKSATTCGAAAACGSIALVSGTPSTATVTVPSGVSCACWPVGTTAAIAAGGCAANVSATTLTVTGPNTVTTVVRYMCFL